MTLAAIIMSSLAIVAALWHGHVVRSTRRGPTPPTYYRECPTCQERTTFWVG